MACGLFGKLIAKRDFIAINIPREVLLGWETWMQSSIAASKHGLGQSWLQAYMQAPLWRFWLGEGICGMEVMGVFMSSMDGVGRHFPLTVFTFSEAGKHFAAPGVDGDQSWYEEAEDFLLSTLDAGEDYDVVLAGLARLRDSPALELGTPQKAIVALHGALITFGAAPLLQAGDLAAAVQMPVTGDQDRPAEEPAMSPGPLGEDAAGEPDLPTPVPENQTEPEAMSVGSGIEDMAGMTEATSSPSPSANADLRESLDAVLAQADNDAEVRVGEPPHSQADFGLAALQAQLQRSDARARSFWWTVGGHDHPAMAMIAQGLPDPQLMSLMLTGKPNQPANRGP